MTAADDKTLTLKTQDASLKLSFADLSGADLLTLALHGREPADRAAATARFLIAEGDVARAEAALKTLEAAPAELAVLRARAERFAKRSSLERARRALDQARGLLAQGRKPDAAAAFATFLEEHKNTPDATNLLDEAAVLLKRATRPTPKLAGDAKLARLRIACETAYRFYLNGKEFDRGTYHPGEFDDIELAVSDKDALAIEAEGDELTERGALYALLEVDGGNYAIATDPTWRWCAEPPEGWQSAPKPRGNWEAASPAYSPHAKPAYAQSAQGLRGYWIWGRGAHCSFRKTVRLDADRTVAAELAQERARQKQATAERGKPVPATLAFACRGAYRLYHNGRHIGCAASYVKEGAAYSLLLRHGDVLGVHAFDLEPADRWIDAKITLGKATAIRTGPSWAYTLKLPPNAWKPGAPLSGQWKAPGSRDSETYRVRVPAAEVFFRKTIGLKRAALPRASLEALRYGRLSAVKKDKATVTYDFKDPQQLADWHSAGNWTWGPNVVVGTSGAFYTGPYRMGELAFHTQVDIPAGLTIGIWGETDRPERRRTPGYEVELRLTRVTNTRRYYDVSLRSEPGGHIASRRIDTSPSRRRLISVLKRAGAFSIAIDKRTVLQAKAPQPLNDDALWRVGFALDVDEKAAVAGVRITGRPDLLALRDSDAARQDRPIEDDGELGEAEGEDPGRDQQDKRLRKAQKKRRPRKDGGRKDKRPK